MNAHLFGKNDSPCAANLASKKAGADKKDIIHPSVVTSIDQNFSKNSFLKSENSEKHLPRIKKALFQYLKDLDLDLKNLYQIMKIF